MEKYYGYCGKYFILSLGTLRGITKYREKKFRSECYNVGFLFKLFFVWSCKSYFTHCWKSCSKLHTTTSTSFGQFWIFVHFLEHWLCGTFYPQNHWQLVQICIPWKMINVHWINKNFLPQIRKKTIFKIRIEIFVVWSD